MNKQRSSIYLSIQSTRLICIVRTAQVSFFQLLRNGAEIKVEIVQNVYHNSEERQKKRLRLKYTHGYVVNTLYNLCTTLSINFLVSLLMVILLTPILRYF